MVKKLKRKKFKFVTGFIILVILIQSCSFIKQFLKSRSEKEILKKNCIVLQKLEQADVSTVEKQISAKANDINDKPKNTKANTQSNKVYFEDSVFMGDSQTEPLDVYNILNKSSVLAKKGQDVIKAKNAVNELINLKPKRVFLLYGMNDLDLFENPNDFKTNYIKLLEEIKQKLPSTEIYIQSIMPVQPKAEQKNKRLSEDRIATFLDIVKQVAEEEKVTYIDIRPIIKDRENLYEPDGIHFNIKFYGLWLDFLKNYLEK